MHSASCTIAPTEQYLYQLFRVLNQETQRRGSERSRKSWTVLRKVTSGSAPNRTLMPSRSGHGGLPVHSKSVLERNRKWTDNRWLAERKMSKVLKAYYRS